jgi:hypothetical protein
MPVVALRAAGLAEVERAGADPLGGTAAPWCPPIRLVPHLVGGLPLIVARSQLGAVDDAGVTVGVGDPAVVITWIPDCGCDACDSGSQDVLDELDEAIVGVVSGAFRRLASGDRVITVSGDASLEMARRRPGLPRSAREVAESRRFDGMAGDLRASWIAGADRSDGPAIMGHP